MVSTDIQRGNGKASSSLISIMADESFWKQFNDLSLTIARMDERQQAMSRDMTRLLEADNAFAAQRQADLEWRRGVDARLQALEDKGIAAWSHKKLSQAAALLALGGALVAGFIEIGRWLIAHWK